MYNGELAVDKPVLKLSDTATFTLLTQNVSPVAIDELRLTDTLPVGFSYVKDSARLLLGPGAVASRNATVTTASVAKVQREPVTGSSTQLKTFDQTTPIAAMESNGALTARASDAPPSCNQSPRKIRRRQVACAKAVTSHRTPNRRAHPDERAEEES